MGGMKTLLVPVMAAAFLLSVLGARGGVPVTAQPGGDAAAPGAPVANAPAAPAEPAWGPPAHGLVIAIEPGEAKVGGPLRLTILVRSATGEAVALPPADAAAWVVLAQTQGDARKAWYTARVPMTPAAGWTATVGAQAVRVGPVDVAALDAYASADARALLTAYVKDPAAPLPQAAGKVADVLEAGLAMAKATLRLGPPGSPALVTSAGAAVTLAPPHLDALPEAARREFLDDLLAQFDRNPWAGQQAHDTCVGLGGRVADRVAAAAFEQGRPPFARLWLATTLADIADPRCVAALEKLLADPMAGVRYVVAYHGPKQKAAALDAAIVAKVRSGDDPRLAAWAMLGFMVHRATVPEEVLAAGLESPDERARATVAEALAAHAGEENIARLTGLLADANERVRGTAARVLAQSGARSPAVLGAMVKALDLEGETARQRLCAALSDLAGRDARYDPAAPADARAKVLADWKAWWAARSGKP
jgi:hypothetical protein